MKHGKHKMKSMRPINSAVAGMTNSMKKHGMDRGKQEYYKSKGKRASMKGMC